MRIRFATIALAVFASTMMLAQDKPDLSGTWILDSAKQSESKQPPGLTLIIRQQDPTIHLSQKSGGDAGKPDFELNCKTDGQDCSMLDGGSHKAQATVWYNGPVLVVMKTKGRKGHVVTKRRFKLAEDAQSMEVELTPIDPQGPPEKLTFVRKQ